MRAVKVPVMPRGVEHKSPVINATTGFRINGAAAASSIPIGNGTNYVASSFTVASPGAAGERMESNGTNWVSAAPTGEQRLASVTVNTNVGTKQALYTVPAGKHLVVTRVVARSASTSLAAIGSGDGLTLGFDAGATDWANVRGEHLQLLTTSTVFVPIVAAGVSYTGDPGLQAFIAYKIGAAADIFGCVFTDNSITATLVIDVFGYIY